MGRSRVGKSRRAAGNGNKASSESLRAAGNRRPRNPDGTWVASVASGPIKPFPFRVGARIGEFKVLRWERHLSPGGRSFGYNPVCRCSCGWEGFVARQNLLHGRSTRCNACAKIKASAKRYWKYKDAMPDDTHRTRLLNRLSAAITRCHNPRNRVFPHYGGRGIQVHQLWREDRSAFLRYVQRLPGWDKPELDLDRTNNDKGYQPGNIRFATKSQNMGNKQSVLALRRRIRELEAEVQSLRRSRRRPT